MSDVDAIISARGLQRSFTLGRTALSYGPVDIPRGGIVALVGQSGVGKTTLLNMFSGVDDLEFATKGYLKLAFSDGYEVNVERTRDFPFERVAHIFQKGYLLPSASATMNVVTGATLANRQISDDEVEAALRQVGLGPGYKVKRPWQISGGEAQRVGIARALVRAAEILFADEPTSNLDARSAAQMLDLLSDWVRADPGRTIVWVSHDLDLVAEKSDWLIVLSAEVSGEDSEDAKHITARCLENPGRQAIEQIVFEDTDPPALPDPVSSTEASLSHNNASRRDQPRSTPRQALKWRLSGKLAVAQLFNERGAFRTAKASEGIARFHRMTSLWEPPWFQPLILGRLSRAFSQFRAEKARKGLARLHHVTSLWEPPWFQPLILARLPRAFSQRNNLIIICAALAVMATLLQILVLSYRDYMIELEDPANCTAVISGASRLTDDGVAVPVDLTSGTLRVLEQRPWLLPRERTEWTQPVTAIWPEASCSSGPAAFGRRDFAKAYVCDAELQDPSSPISVPLLVTTGNEPILERSSLIAGPYAGRTLLDLSRSDPPYNDFFYSGGQIFISEVLAADLERQQTDISDGLCIEYAGTHANFFVEGVVDRLPAPRAQRFEAYVTESSLTEILNAQATNFSQIQIYFDPLRIDEVRAFLETEGYNTVGDTLAQTESLIENARLKIITLALVILMVAGLFAAVVFTLSRNQLTQNATSFAVLQSMGMDWTVACRQTAIELSYLVCVAWVVVTSIFAVGFLLFTLELISPILVDWTLLIGVLALVGVVMEAIIVAVTIMATRKWFRETRRRSEVLG